MKLSPAKPSLCGCRHGRQLRRALREHDRQGTQGACLDLL
jgi:hypothetical protein